MEIIELSDFFNFFSLVKFIMRFGYVKIFYFRSLNFYLVILLEMKLYLD